MKPGIGTRFKMLCVLLALCAAGLAQAQAYPSRPVRLIVPYPAGGVVDLVARAVADKISQYWGQVIVVEPRPGGGADEMDKLINSEYERWGKLVKARGIKAD